MKDWFRSIIALGRQEMDKPDTLPSTPAAPETHRLFHGAMSVIAIAVAAFSVLALPANKIIVIWPPLLLKAALLALLLAGTLFYRWRRVTRLQNLIIMAFWAIAVSSLYVFPMYMAARQPAELCDAPLARADAAIGIVVPDVLEFAARFPLAQRWLGIAYDALILLVALAIMLPPLFGRMDLAKTYALSCVIAAMISIPMLAVVPAIGPWETYGFAPDGPQRQYAEVLVALRSDEWLTLDPMKADGLITFPSFHAILAVLAAAALWFVKYLRWLAAALAVLIVISTLTTGWHYLVDVWAGLLLAWLAWLAARALVFLEMRSGSRHGSNNLH